MKGFVYLFRAGFGYKVGNTNNLERRLVELTSYAKARYKTRPVLVHAIESASARDIERKIHHLFRHWRDDEGAGHEWYLLPVELVEWFRQQTDPLTSIPDTDAIIKAQLEAVEGRKNLYQLTSVRGAAEILGVEVGAVEKLMREGGIAWLNFGWGTKRIELAEVYRIKAILDQRL